MTNEQAKALGERALALGMPEEGRMTNEKLQAIKARLAAATPGPWEWNSLSGFVWGADLILADLNWADAPTFRLSNAEPNAELIANAPTDIAALVAEVQRLQVLRRELSRRCETLLECLEAGKAS